MKKYLIIVNGQGNGVNEINKIKKTDFSLVTDFDFLVKKIENITTCNVWILQEGAFINRFGTDPSITESPFACSIKTGIYDNSFDFDNAKKERVVCLTKLILNKNKELLSKHNINQYLSKIIDEEQRQNELINMIVSDLIK